MRMIEGQFRFAGLSSTMAVIGHKFSYEAKNSKATMCLFELGKAPHQIFHVLVYDLAYINVGCVRVVSDEGFKKNLESFK